MVNWKIRSMYYIPLILGISFALLNKFAFNFESDLVILLPWMLGAITTFILITLDPLNTEEDELKEAN